MKNTKALEDGISKLPEPIKHHIISFLPEKEAGKTSLLSKAWLSTWHTRPNLYFVGTPEALKRQEDFLNWIDTTLQRYHELKNGIDTLHIGLRSVSNDRVNRWLQIAAENGIKSLQLEFQNYIILPPTVFESESLVNLALDCCQLMPKTLTRIRCHCLRKLSLFRVYLDEVMLQRVMSSCTCIEDLEIEHCKRIETIKVTKIQKLRKLSVCSRGNFHVEVEAPSLEHFSYSNPDSGEVNSIDRRLEIRRCENLMCLRFFNAPINDEFFLDIAQKFPHLEDLEIHNCRQLERIMISSQSIKRIKLVPSFRTIEAKIDIPGVGQFEFQGDFIPLVSSIAHSGNCAASQIELYIPSWRILDGTWFSALRNLLTNLNPSEISLKIYFRATVAGLVEDEVRNNAICPLPKVQELYVDFDASVCSDAAYPFADCIFWTCHPKTIVQIWWPGKSSLDNNDAMKVFFDMLIFRKDQKHSSLQKSKSWQKDLKDVTLKIIEGDQEIEHPELLDWGTLTKIIATKGCSWCKLVLSLDWETSDMKG